MNYYTVNALMLPETRSRNRASISQPPHYAPFLSLPPPKLMTISTSNVID